MDELKDSINKLLLYKTKTDSARNSIKKGSISRSSSRSSNTAEDSKEVKDQDHRTHFYSAQAKRENIKKNDARKDSLEICSSIEDEIEKFIGILSHMLMTNNILYTIEGSSSHELVAPIDQGDTTISNSGDTTMISNSDTGRSTMNSNSNTGDTTTNTTSNQFQFENFISFFLYRMKICSNQNDEIYSTLIDLLDLSAMESGPQDNQSQSQTQSQSQSQTNHQKSESTTMDNHESDQNQFVTLPSSFKLPSLSKEFVRPFQQFQSNILTTFSNLKKNYFKKELNFNDEFLNMKLILKFLLLKQKLSIKLNEFLCKNEIISDNQFYDQNSIFHKSENRKLFIDILDSLSSITFFEIDLKSDVVGSTGKNFQPFMSKNDDLIATSTSTTAFDTRSNTQATTADTHQRSASNQNHFFSMLGMDQVKESIHQVYHEMVKTFDHNDATTSEKDTIENEANQRNDKSTKYEQKKIQELESDLDFAREEILNLKKIIMALQHEKMKLQLEIVNYKNDHNNQ